MEQIANDLQRLLDRARAGDQEASTQLVQRFSQPLLLVIRRHLQHRIRTAFDSTDFLQDAWRSFFAGPLHEETFTDPTQLVAFLSKICVNKVRMTERAQLASEKRDRRREVPLTEAATLTDRALVDPQPTPDSQAAASDSWAAFISSLSEIERRCLDLIRQGRSQRETADQLGVSIRTVGRVVHRAFTILGAVPRP
jgi:RNA polymerase sigma factor (sigma-70 family)